MAFTIKTERGENKDEIKGFWNKQHKANYSVGAWYLVVQIQQNVIL